MPTIPLDEWIRLLEDFYNQYGYLGYELIAALLWNTAYCLLGYFIAAEFEQLQRLFERTTWILLGALLLALIA